jgi:hypothetical protein
MVVIVEASGLLLNPAQIQDLVQVNNKKAFIGSKMSLSASDLR